MRSRQRVSIRPAIIGLLAMSAAIGACSSSTPSSTQSGPGDSGRPTAPGSTTRPPAKPQHVFVINLENKGFEQTFGSASPAKYLNETLRPKGQLLTQYYGVAHNSLGNYLAQISGQSVNSSTQADCLRYVAFTLEGMAELGQAKGEGCLYPASIPTLANQLSEKQLAWKGYMEDLDKGTRGRTGTCPHPELDQVDPTRPVPGDQYATKHNPFAYFQAVLDLPDCKDRVVPLEQLTQDLGSTGTTPNLTYITPNMCNDGHDEPCVDGAPGGLVSADAWLKQWVPKILDSPAFKADGLLVVTFDEADTGDQSGEASASCCNQQPGPNVQKPGIKGPGGGRVGAVVVGSTVKPGSTNDTPYNHYALLCSIEELFGLSKLGYAGQPGLKCFGSDVYNAS